MTDFRPHRNRIAAAFDTATERWLKHQPPADAETMARIRAGELRPENPRATWAAVAKLAAFQPDERHLDIGCGAALLTIPQLRAAQTAYFGLDVSKRTLAVVDERGAGLFRGLCAADGANIPFADGTFSLVTAVGVSEFLPPPYLFSVLKEVKRVLAPGGRLVMDFLDGTTSGAEHSRQLEAARGLNVFIPTYAEIDRLIADAGLILSRSVTVERRLVQRIARGFGE